MEKIRKGILYSVIASEGIHIFCCVLPTVFSVLSLLAGMGMIATMPGFIDEMHHVIHGYEIPMIVTSAIVLAFGWVLYYLAQKIDCEVEVGCCDHPCAPKKDRTKFVLIVATILLVFNVAIYMGFHRVNDINTYYAVEHNHDHENHNHNH